MARFVPKIYKKKSGDSAAGPGLKPLSPGRAWRSLLACVVWRHRGATCRRFGVGRDGLREQRQRATDDGGTTLRARPIYTVVANIVMAYVVMAYIAVAHMVMAYTFMPPKAMAYMVMAYAVDRVSGSASSPLVPSAARYLATRAPWSYDGSLHMRHKGRVRAQSISDIIFRHFGAFFSGNTV